MSDTPEEDPNVTALMASLESTLRSATEQVNLDVVTNTSRIVVDQITIWYKTAVAAGFSATFAEWLAQKWIETAVFKPTQRFEHESVGIHVIAQIIPEQDDEIEESEPESDG